MLFKLPHEPWKTVGRAGLLSAVAGGVLLGALRGGDVEVSPMPVIVLMLLALITIVTANLQAWRKWRSLDEAAQRARLVGGFWGGSIAAGIAAFVAMFSLYGVIRIDLMAPGLADQGGLFGLGVAVCIAVQAVGALIGWAVWWLRASR